VQALVVAVREHSHAQLATLPITGQLHPTLRGLGGLQVTRRAAANSPLRQIRPAPRLRLIRLVAHLLAAGRIKLPALDALDKMLQLPNLFGDLELLVQPLLPQSAIVARSVVTAPALSPPSTNSTARSFALAIRIRLTCQQHVHRGCRRHCLLNRAHSGSSPPRAPHS